MSSVSTTLSVPPPSSFFEGLFNMSYQDMYTCSIYNIKMIMFILLLSILFSCLMAFFGGEPKQKCSVFCEPFANDQFYSYKDTQYSNYQSASLTALNDSEGNQKNILFGQVSRIIDVSGDAPVFNLDVYANLYIINGNPFSEDPVANRISKIDPSKLKYRVFLENSKTGKNIFVGDLKKDGDGLYKLKLKTRDLKYVDNDRIAVVFFDGKNDIPLLQGRFA
jgi:hypothetical protein